MCCAVCVCVCVRARACVFLPSTQSSPPPPPSFPPTQLQSALVHERPTTLQDCVKWSCARFAELYRNRILQLRHKFPADTRTSQGEPFWSGTKRFPSPCAIDFGDPLHAAFITTTTRLRGSLYGLRYDASVHTPAWFASAVAASPPAPFEPSDGIAIPTTEAEAEEMKKAAEEAAKGGGAWDVQAMAEALAKQLPTPASLAGFRCTPIDFEKDDDLHVSWVTAGSNLRARNYRIQECDKHESKLIAGKIIPAIATTTALVSGLICLEVYKLAGSCEALTMERLRSSSLNLAVAFVGLSEPAPPKRSLLTLPAGATMEVAPSALVGAAGGSGGAGAGGGGGGGGASAAGGARVWAWSAWDSITLQGPMTLQGLLDFVSSKLGRTATWVNVGSTTIYSNMHKKSMVKERLPRALSDVYSAVLKAEVVSHSRTLALNITVEDEVDAKGERKSIEFPEIRYLLGPEELRGGGGGGGGGGSAAAAAAAAPAKQPTPSAITPALAAEGV
jgi:ubiquitin-activating enzyme E1